LIGYGKGDRTRLVGAGYNDDVPFGSSVIATGSCELLPRIEHIDEAKQAESRKQTKQNLVSGAATQRLRMHR
jgi:hypothetical protein